ncbi:hypothetical protein IB633_02105 [Francisella philomiragia]|uniref:hypothetical protein n=1 Tax=Francisella philomiragia TaxID=28110 RepID=UPI000AF653EF|nr:hypothetical protein [Francisella philomiragia]MBK2019939.1 hypothetical protein [Francisella philomiragia]MBK2029889.1 hypothetical protein [Francisella philomiragia]
MYYKSSQYGHFHKTVELTSPKFRHRKWPDIDKKYPLIIRFNLIVWIKTSYLIDSFLQQMS